MAKVNILKLVTLGLGLFAIAMVLLTDNRGVRVVLSSATGTSVSLSRTGAPLAFGSEATCLAGGCHQIGPLAGESLSIEVRDSTNTQVVSGYESGQNYKINVTHTSTGSNWGFQITAIDNATLARAGDMSSADGTTVSDRLNSGREYTNHSTPTTGNWVFNWAAPASNVGTVTFYAAGVRSTGSGNLNARVYTASRALPFSAPPGTLQFSSSTYSQGENGGTATITVTRTGGSGGAASVQFSNPGGTATGGASCSAGVDYITPGGTLNWGDGDAVSKTFAVTLCNESIFEGSETVNLALSNATGATLGSQTSATLTITNDDGIPSITINNVTQAEGNAGTTNFIFTVSLSNPTTQTVTVNFATANGTADAGSDYQAIGTTVLTFNPLETSKNITVLVTGDTTFEPDEGFVVNLSGASAATIADSQGQGTIQNDDAAPQPGTLQFSAATYSQGENDGTATITVTRSGGSSGAASVQFSNPAGGSATGGASCSAGVDYVTPAGTLNWGDGDANSKTFAVTLCNESIFEGSETVNLALSNATGATLGSQTSATLTITNDDSQPSITINDVTQAEGNAGTTNFIFTVSLSNPTTQTVTVNFATADGTATAGSDYQAIGTTLLTFNPLETSKNITVLVNGDTTFEPDEGFVVNLSGASAATIGDSQGQGTIQSDDGPPQPGTLQFSAATYSQGENGGTATITVTRAGGSSGAASVQFSNPAGGSATGGASCSAGVDYVTPAGTLNWGDGDASNKTFAVTLCNESIFEGSETVNLALSNATGATLGSQTSATLTITNDDSQPSITINDVTQAEGNAGTTNFIFTVSLSNPTTQTVTVNYVTADGTATIAGSDYQTIGATLLTFNPLETSKNITVLVNGDTTVEPDESFVVNLSGASAATMADSQGLGTILTDDGGQQPSTVQFSAAGYNLGEGNGSLIVTVNRVGTVTGSATVEYATSDTAAANPCNLANGAASSRCDYLTTLGTLQFANGESSKVISVPIVDDVYAEGAETFLITLSNPVGVTLGSPATATLTINDNDSVNGGVNPVDTADFFVRQHYVDFLNREPDTAGRLFWVNEITSCGADAQCIEVKRINVSAAFFLSIEFQETGYLVYRIYKSGFGNLAGAPVPVRFTEFLKDTQRIGQGVQVGIGNWEAQLEANKQSYVLSFVQRPEFLAAYPNTLTADQLVAQMDTNAGGVLSVSERANLVAVLGGTPSDVTKRASVLRSIAEHSGLRNAEFNKAFVLMQYFGYLRRNPNDVPDSDFSGYNFWLGKLNSFGGNFVTAEMVKAFILSGEYRHRFGP